MVEDLFLVAPRGQVRDGHATLNDQPVTKDVLLPHRFVLQYHLDAQQTTVALVEG